MFRKLEKRCRRRCVSVCGSCFLGWCELQFVRERACLGGLVVVDLGGAASLGVAVAMEAWANKS